jgi:hypothetical protein
MACPAFAALRVGHLAAPDGEGHFHVLMRPPVAVTAALLLVCSLTGAAAGQQGLGLGVAAALTSPYVWRGLTRANGWSAQPEAYLVVDFDGNLLSAGLWGSNELGAAGPNQLSDLGPGGSGLAEVDAWIQYARRSVSLGFIRYEYQGTAPGRTSASNTSELYATLRLLSLPYFATGVSGYLDVDRVHGLYVEADGGIPVFGSPVRNPYFWIVIGWLAGYSLGQEVNPRDPSQAANFARAGFTHFDFSLALGARRFLVVPLPWEFDAHVQFNTDPFTKRTSAAPTDTDRSVRLFVRTSFRWTHTMVRW